MGYFDDGRPLSRRGLGVIPIAPDNSDYPTGGGAPYYPPPPDDPPPYQPPAGSGSDGGGITIDDIPSSPGTADPPPPAIPYPGMPGIPVTRDDIDGAFRIRLLRVDYPRYDHMVDYWYSLAQSSGAASGNGPAGWWLTFNTWMEQHIGPALPYSPDRADQPPPYVPPPTSPPPAGSPPPASPPPVYDPPPPAGGSGGDEGGDSPPADVPETTEPLTIPWAWILVGAGALWLLKGD
jgi:hypothetical protein